MPPRRKGRASGAEPSARSAAGVSAAGASVGAASTRASSGKGKAPARHAAAKVTRQIFAFGSVRSGRDTTDGAAKLALPKVQVPRKPTSGDLLTCRRCNAKAKDTEEWGEWVVKVGKNGQKTRAPVKEACGSCFKTFMQGDYETQAESFDAYCDECEDDDKKRDEFDCSTEVREGTAAKTWAPTCMDLKRTQQMRAMVWYRGLRPSEFKQKFGFLPSELGYTTQDLVHPDQSLYKGTLVRDDNTFGSLGVSYCFETLLAVEVKEERMGPERQIRENQAMDLFTYFTQPSAEEDGNIKKLRLTTLTPEDVALKAKERGEAAAAAAEKPESSDEEDDDDEPMQEVPTDARTNVFAGHTLRAGSNIGHTAEKTMNDKKRKAAEAVALTPDGKSSVAPGTSATCDEASDVDEQAATDPITRRIRDICLVSVLANNRLGHKRRRLRERARTLSIGDDESCKVEASRYLERLNLADIADKFSSQANVRVIPKAEYTVGLVTLKPYIPAWPTEVQMSLLQRECAELADKVLEVGMIKSLMSLLSLWEFQGEVNEDGVFMFQVATQFDCLAPNLGSVDCSWKERCKHFESSLVNEFFCPLMRATIAGTKVAARAALMELEQILVAAPVVQFGDDEDSFGNSLFITLQACRALLHLLSPETNKHVDDYIAVFTSTTENESPNPTFLSVTSVAKSLDFWRIEHSECKKKAATHDDAMDNAKDLQAIFNDQSECTQRFTLWESIAPHVHTLVDQMAKTRAGALSILAERVVQTADECSHKMLSMVVNLEPESAATSETAEDQLRIFNAGSALLEAVTKAKIVDVPKPQWQKAIQKAVAVKPKFTYLISEFEFGPWVCTVAGEKLVEAESRDAFVERITKYRSCRDPDTQVPPKIREGLEEVWRKFVEAIVRSDDEEFGKKVTLCESALALLADLLQESVKGDPKSKGRGVVASLLVAARSLDTALDEFNRLAADAKGRTENEEGEELLMQVAALRDEVANARGSVPFSVDWGKVVTTEAEATATVNECGPMLVDRMKAQLDAKFDEPYDECDDASCSVRAALGGCRQGETWSKGLTADAGFKACLSKARKTIFANKNSALVKRVDHIKRQHDKIVGAMKTLAVAADIEWSTRTVSMVHRGWATVFEGLVLYHCQQKVAAAKLKALIVKEETLARRQLFYDLAHPAILGLVAKAKALEPMVD